VKEPGPPTSGRAGKGHEPRGVLRGLSEVGRAALAVRRATGWLVSLLGDDDPVVVYAAALALEALGVRAVVGSLTAALPRGSSSRPG
jgi:hypothetical protein